MQQDVLHPLTGTGTGGVPPRRAVVTGGAGFLGSPPVRARCWPTASRWSASTTSSPARPANVAHLLEHPGFRLVRCDVTDYVHVPGPVDLVLHFASPGLARSTTCSCRSRRSRSARIGTLHALGLAKEKGARFVLASTSEVYGDPLVHPQPETYWGNVNPVGPRGVYDEAKRFGEALTTAYRGSARRRHRHRADLQHLRPADAPERRPGHPDLHPPGARRRAAHRGRRRRADPVDLLRRRPGARASWPSPPCDHPGPVNIGNPDELTVLQLAEDVVARDRVGVARSCTSTGRSTTRRCAGPTPPWRRELLGWAPARAVAAGAGAAPSSGSPTSRSTRPERRPADLDLSAPRGGRGARAVSARAPEQVLHGGATHLLDPGPGQPHVDLRAVRVARRGRPSRGCQSTRCSCGSSAGPHCAGRSGRTAAPTACRTPWRGGRRRCRRRAAAPPRHEPASAAQVEPSAPVLRARGPPATAGAQAAPRRAPPVTTTRWPRVGERAGDGRPALGRPAPRAPTPPGVDARTTPPGPAGDRQAQVQPAGPPVAGPARGATQPAPAVDLVLVRSPGRPVD